MPCDHCGRTGVSGRCAACAGDDSRERRFGTTNDRDGPVCPVCDNASTLSYRCDQCGKLFDGEATAGDADE